MSFRKSITAAAMTLCALSATGCSNASFDFKGPSISFSQNMNQEGSEEYKAGNFEGALEIFDQMIERFPEEPTGYMNRGATLISLNRLQEALEATNKAIKLGSENPKLYSNKALILFRLNQSPDSLTEALALVNKSIDLGPDSADADSYNLRGSIRQNMGDNTGAIPDFTKAIELDKNYANGWNNRGATKLQLNDNQGGISDLNRAIEIDPNYANAYRVRALAYSNLSNLIKACADMKKASSLGDAVAINILKKNARTCD